MYVREKKIRRGEKTYSYWQLVRGTRVDGQVRQTVVAHLGPAQDRQYADKLARLKGLLCGAEGCGEAGVREYEMYGKPITMTVKLPGGRTRKCPFVFCEAHLEAADNGELKRAWPVVEPQDRSRGKHARSRS